MNNPATSQYALAGQSPRQNFLSDFRAAGYIKEQSVRAHESLDTGLVIKTKEGDQVTLTANSFMAMDAYMYDSKGMVQTDSGHAAFSHSQRAISLASGESFSFSVQGDLSETEMEDIEAILKDLDGVISEMTQGDMSGAVDKALEMGDYDSVSSFAADISYQRSFEMRSSVAAATTGALPAGEDTQEQKPTSVSPTEFSPVANRRGRNHHRGFADFDKFFKQMEKQLSAHEDQQVVRAKDPINKLFNHHLDGMDKIGEEIDSLFAAVETAMNNINSLVEEMMGNMFGEELTEAGETEEMDN